MRKTILIILSVLVLLMAGVTAWTGNPQAFIPLLALVAFVVYFLPSIIAWRQKRKNDLGIYVLNCFLGWTLIGWVVALAWAVSPEASKATPQRNHIDDLQKLSDLKTKGVITESEFEIQKKKLLEA